MSNGVRARPERPLRRAAGAVAIALLVSAVACGSEEVRTDGDASPTTMSMQRWSSSLERVCMALDERFADLSDAELRSVDEAIEHAEAVEDYAAELESEATRLGARIDRPAITEFEEGTAELSDAAAALARATRDGDAAAASDAVDAIEAAGAEINDVANELKLDGCDGF